MRPDQHKQKKSSQYKKKHGYQEKDSKSNQSISKSEANTSKDTLDEVPSQETQSFSRRQVKSNWDRYEESRDETKSVGDDFDTVLSYASRASSHFRFQEEKDWDLDHDFEDILTIDTQKIAQVLGKLSFCEKYGFNPKDFDPSLLTILDGGSSFSEVPSSQSHPAFISNKESFDFNLPQQTVKLHPTTTTNVEPATDRKLSEPKQSLMVEEITKDHSDQKTIDRVHSITKVDSFDQKASANEPTHPPVALKPVITDDLESELDDLLSESTSSAKGSANANIDKTTKPNSFGLASQPFSDCKLGGATEQDLDDFLDELIS